jgi:N-acyl-D-aspartate/D-glutamate deacylase
MKAGAFGFSADKSLEDRPDDGSYLPTQVAADEEFYALCEILREFGVGHIGWTRDIPDRMGANKDREMLLRMMELSGRPLHWSIVHQVVGRPEIHKEQLAWLEEVHQRGLPMYAQAMAVDISQKFTMEDYNMFDTMPRWLEATLGTLEQRKAKLADPARRPGLKADADAAGRGSAEAWAGYKVLEVSEERNHRYEGHTIAQIAQREGKHPVDAFLDLAVADNLKTLFAAQLLHVAREEILKHPATHISLSDGGAHTRYQTAATWPTHFLCHWVRDQRLMSVEDAAYKMSALPAWIAGFRDRGILREGMAADVIVYDLDQIGLIGGEPQYATDFPGGERRLIQKAKGYRYTIVNGVVTFEESIATGALPGKLLRSYDMAR